MAKPNPPKTPLGRATRVRQAAADRNKPGVYEAANKHIIKEIAKADKKGKK